MIIVREGLGTSAVSQEGGLLTPQAGFSILHGPDTARRGRLAAPRSIRQRIIMSQQVTGKR